MTASRTPRSTTRCTRSKPSATAPSRVGSASAPRADLWLLHVEGAYEGGHYPSLAYPRINADNAFFVNAIDFSTLRGQDSYTWNKYSLSIDTPIPLPFGKRWQRGSRLKLGYEIFSLRGEKGEGLANQGFSLSATYAF